MQIGFIGLGKMGSRMVEKLIIEGHDVVVWNRTEAVSEELSQKLQSSDFRFQSDKHGQFSIGKNIEAVIAALPTPRVIWVMLPAGEATEEILTQVAKSAQSQDIVIDGGNAHFTDTQRRFETFALNNIRFLGIGVSGGVHALSNGYPLMVGGDVSAYRYITTLLDSLAKPHGGHTYFGLGGAGHFVKMIHNGIEYGMMQAIGEGFGVLEKAPYELHLPDVASLFTKSTIVSGFLMDRTADALQKDAILEHLTGEIDSGGEADWTIEQAKKEGVFIENIEQSLDFRRRSKKDEHVRNSFAAKLIAALRHEFGGHEVKKK
jgi:6-phosphogluconate dehydrogenase